jgi:hypothetical protein
MENNKGLIPTHGGYRKLRSFQSAQLVYDLTVIFCDRFIDKHSRTHDQMVQAARSGVQNIAEGSMASTTSKKTELEMFFCSIFYARQPGGQNVRMTGHKFVLLPG